MPTFQKIPRKLKETNIIAVGGYAVFTDSILKAMCVAAALAKKDETTGIPACGRITVKGKKYFYCLYGFVGDDDVFSIR